MIKVGFCKDDLEDYNGFYDVDSSSCIEDIAKDFSGDNHQIDEASDLEFTVYVQDESGQIHKVKLFTEYELRYEVDTCEKLTGHNIHDKD